MPVGAIADDLQSAIDEICEEYKAAMADGRATLAEMFGLILLVGRKVVDVTKNLPVDNAEKKRQALIAVERFIDDVVIPYDIPNINNWVEGFVDQAMKPVLMAAADAAIEFAVNLLSGE